MEMKESFQTDQEEKIIREQMAENREKKKEIFEDYDGKENKKKS